MPSWLGKAAASGSLASFAGANPFKFLHAIAQMSDLEQRIYLEMIGEGLKVRPGAPERRSQSIVWSPRCADVHCLMIRIKLACSS